MPRHSFLKSTPEAMSMNKKLRELITNSEHNVVNLDNLTYAGNLESLAFVKGHARLGLLSQEIQ